MKMYKFFLLITLLSSCASTGVLPNKLRFGQRKQSVLKQLEKNTFARNSRGKVVLVKESKTLTAVNYNSGVLVNGKLAWHFTLFFQRNKLAGLQVQYDVNPQLDHRVLYDSICNKFGTPVVLQSNLRKNWICMWNAPGSTIKLKVERTENYGDVIILDFMSDIDNERIRDLLESELSSIGG